MLEEYSEDNNNAVITAAEKLTLMFIVDRQVDGGNWFLYYTKTYVMVLLRIHNKCLNW